MSASTCPSAQAYHVAWLCALPQTERLAAEILLDERHPTPAISKIGGYIYTCGRLGSHNTVIACLSAGGTGNINSAQLIGPLRECFPNIEVVVLVGIAGGIPRSPRTNLEEHVRLGDVVIATPSGTHNGVINPQSGKFGLQGFERTGSSDKANNSLRQAAGVLSTDILRDPNILDLHHSRLAGSSRLLRPDSEDLLFKAEYPHRNAEDLKNPCGNCDKEQRIRRPDSHSGRMQCHFGLVLSSDELVKSGTRRDQLSEQYPDALCIEMEAAGLDASHCLVIRGISDYADSHKNKLWQGYAAANAAAVAKWILLRAQFEKRGLDTPQPAARGTQGYSHENLSLRDFSNLSLSIFQGRKEILTQLYETLILHEPTTDLQGRIFVIYGTSGCGKTAVCNKFYAGHRDYYWAAWRLDAGTEESLLKSFDNIAETMPEMFPESSRRSGHLARRIVKWLESLNRFWLLIYDNTDDHTILRERYFPRSRYGTVLITTRSKQVINRNTLGFLKLDLLGEEDAGCLLLKMILSPTEQVSEESAQTLCVAIEIARKLGYLPQGLVLAGSMIAQDDLDLTQSLTVRLQNYLQAISQPPSSSHPLQNFWEPDIDQSEELSLAKPYAMKVTSMKEKALRSGVSQRAADALELLYFFAFLSSTEISIDILMNYLNCTTFAYETHVSAFTEFLWQHGDTNKKNMANLSLDVLAESSESLEEKGTRVRQALSYLASNHLIDLQNTISLHPLVQACARVSRFKETHGEGDKHALRAICTLVGSMSWAYDFASSKYRLSLLPHIQAYRNCYDSRESKLYEKMRFEEALTIHLCLAYVYFEGGQFQTAMQMQERAVKQASSRLGEYDDLRLKAQAQLATSYHDLNGPGQRAEALRLRELVRCSRKTKISSLNGAEERVLLYRRAYLSSLSDLADSYMCFPEHRFEALAIREEVLAASLAIGDAAATFEAERRLARTCHELGQRHRALELRQKIQKAHVHEQNDKPPDQVHLVIMSDLADSYCDQGQWIKATEWRKYVVEKRTSLLGDQHYDTVAAISNLAISYSKMERYEEAVTQRKIVCNYFDTIYGPDHPGTWQSYLDLGRAYIPIDLVQAMDVMLGVLEASEDSQTEYGQDHFQTITSAKESLARVLEKMSKDTEQWREYYGQAVSIRNEVLETTKSLSGEDSSEALIALGDLAHSHSYNLESLELAIEIGEDVCRLQAEKGERNRVAPYDNLGYLINLRDLAMSSEKRANIFKRLDKAAGGAPRGIDPSEVGSTASNRSLMDEANANDDSGQLRGSDRGNVSITSQEEQETSHAYVSDHRAIQVVHYEDDEDENHALEWNNSGSPGSTSKEGSGWTDEDTRAQDLRLKDVQSRWQYILDIHRQRPASDQEQATFEAMIDLANFYSRSDIGKWQEAIELLQPAIQIMEKPERLGPDHSFVKNAKFRLVYVEQQNKLGLVSNWVGEQPAHYEEMVEEPFHLSTP